MSLPCLPGSAKRFANSNATAMKPFEDDSKAAVHEVVTEYYGKVLQSSKDLKTSACCAADAPHPVIRKALKQVPTEVTSRFYGCGNPIPFGIEGLTVLDLGSGSGQDCYVAANLVGEKGQVIGIDMTDEQLDVARAYAAQYCTETLGYRQPNLRFVKGYIELLRDAGIAKESVDLVISNCVVNLSPRKDQVLQSVHDVLKEGGEFYFSDVYCDRRLPAEVRQHDVLIGECLGGAMYVEDFRRTAQRVGFPDPRVLSCTPITVEDPELKALVGNAQFWSITYRLFKCAGLEDKCEDFGQVAYYQGTIPEHPHFYDLDDHHRFFTGKPMLVCGNSALMTGSSWLGPHFKVIGDMSTHYGLFDCAPVTATTGAVSSAAPAGGCC